MPLGEKRKWQRGRAWRSDQFYTLLIIQLWSQTPAPADRVICKINKAGCRGLPSWTRLKQSSWASLSSVAGPKLSLETIRRMMCLQRRRRLGKEAALNHLRPTSLAFLSLFQDTPSHMHTPRLLIMLFAYLQILTKCNFELPFVLDLQTTASLNCECYLFPFMALQRLLLGSVITLRTRQRPTWLIRDVDSNMAHLFK